jgi:hypothetical protein
MVSFATEPREAMRFLAASTSVAETSKTVLTAKGDPEAVGAKGSAADSD